MNRNRLLLTAFFAFLVIGISVGQTTVNFGFTGGNQTFTVPDCVTSITITAAGAEGGSGGVGGAGGNGGNGAVVTATITVSPGDVISMNVGQMGSEPAGGYGGGGIGHLSIPANAAYNSNGGGGATTVSIGGAPFIIAAGGGGAGGGSNNVAGGNGGCATGSPGANTFGFGGGGGTQVAGGAGGVPWAGTPPGGSAGTLGQGGQGGPWQTASGGGGGGGFYGGGGGGNDGCCTGANGGGGGGGGSSLVPAGAGCVAGTNTGNGSVSITYTGGLFPVANNTGSYCSGETIQLTAIGGVNYSWTGPNGFTSNLQNPTIPNSTVAMNGTYTVTVTDPTCPGSASATTDVVIIQSPTVDPIADIQVCNTDVVTVPAFTGNSPTTNYAWTNSNTGIGMGPAGNGNIFAFFGTATVSDQVGTITVTPSNAQCVGPAETFTITVLRDPSLTVSNDTTICENGTATLVATASGGGGAPYTYYWDHTLSTLGTQDVNPLVASSYTVYAESTNGCTSNPQTIDVTLHPPLSGNITPWDTICPGYPTTVMANVAGGIGQPYTFVWSSGETQTGPNTFHEITANPPSTQNYTVTITDGCETTPLIMTTNVYVAPLPVPQYEVLDPEQCEPAVFHIVNTTDSAMSQYNYWLVDGEYTYVNQDTITTPEFWAGTYDIQMIITSFLGCVDSLTFTEALEVKPQPTASFQHSPNPVQMFNTNVIFTSTSTLADYYEWYFESGFPSTSTSETAITQFPDGVTGTYNVVLMVESELGCRDTVDYDLIVFPEVLIYAPNSFTPDEDEFNQGWRVYMEGIDFQDFELLIFNRWGELVWESHDIEVEWDGTYGGQKLPVGTYSWKITTKDILNDGKYTYTGHVNIIK